MFIVDDIARTILTAIADYANEAYLSDLQNYLKSIRFLYEKGEMEEEEYRRLEFQVTEAIKNLRRLQMESERRPLQIDIL